MKQIVLNSPATLSVEAAIELRHGIIVAVYPDRDVHLLVPYDSLNTSRPDKWAFFEMGKLWGAGTFNSADVSKEACLRKVLNCGGKVYYFDSLADFIKEANKNNWTFIER